MKRIGFLLILILTANLLYGADSKKAPPVKVKPQLVKLTADDIFRIVEHALKESERDRADTKKFLQDALDGKLHMAPPGTNLSGPSRCIRTTSPCSPCMRCAAGLCRCSLCCDA